MSRTLHVCLDVRGFLKTAKFPNDFTRMFRHDDGRPMTPEEARDQLFDELQRGHNVLPLGPPCEGFDYSGGGCPGHPMEGDSAGEG